MKRVLLVGNEANLLKKQVGDNTHKWRVYVTGPSEGDVSYFVSKVIFHLHSSFDNPDREIKSPPFQIEEKGWGEFEIRISVFFVDVTIPPLELIHNLILFNPIDAAMTAWTETYHQVIIPPNSFLISEIDKHLLPTPLPSLRGMEPELTNEEMIQIELIDEITDVLVDNLKTALQNYKQTQNNINRTRHEIKKLTETFQN